MIRILIASLFAFICVSGCVTSTPKNRSLTARRKVASEPPPIAQDQTENISDLDPNLIEDQVDSDIDEVFEEKPSTENALSPNDEERIVLSWPIGSRHITGQFGERRRRHRHSGIDISAPKGTPVFAPADGKVLSIRSRRGYGKTIMITHDTNWNFVTIYGHLSQILVRGDEVVRRGQVIGLVGRTGHTSGPHLHFEVRVYVKAVDPRLYLP